MSRISVVHLCRGRDWRGGERQVLLLARMLAHRSDVSQIIATGQDSRLAQALREEGLEALEVPWSIAHDPRVTASVVRRVRASPAGAGPLVLHAHDSHALTLGLIASALLRRPLVATRRSIAPAGWQWRRPARVIAVSAAVEAALLARGVRRDRVTHIPSAIDLAAVQRDTARREVAAPFLVTVGALTAEKGHATLIDAMSMLIDSWPGLRLLLLGEGPERSALLERAERFGIGSRIELIGEVADPVPWIRSARLMIQPSHREALGTAVLTAMAVGTPIVASRTGGLVELLDDGAGVLVPPEDALALAAAIHSLLSVPEEGAKRADRARARIGEYDAPGMTDRVVEVYRSALGDT